MSHFTVTVRLSAERLARHSGDVEEALNEIMAPFYEGTEDERFITFQDEEDELRGRYETESTERIRLADGTLVLPWDKQFQVPGQFGIGSGTHKVPDHLERVHVPFKETYPTFEAWAKDWCGHEGPDEKTGRYGHWSNPNAKWDWFQIGGRWSGYYPVVAGTEIRTGEPGVGDNKPEAGHSDIVKVAEIDMAKVAVAETKAAEKFWAEWQRYLAGEKFGAFEGPRSRALDIGLLDVVREPIATPAPGTRVRSWETVVAPNDERRHWSDVMKLVTRDEFFREYMCFFDELSTYAALDDAGWSQPGRMGCFASSDATADSRRKYLAEFSPRFIEGCGPDDLLVAVDCHI